MTSATVVTLPLPPAVEKLFDQASSRAVLLRDIQISLPPGTREIAGKSLDDILEELDRHGGTDLEPSGYGDPGKYRCRCRIYVQGSMVWAAGFGQSRLEAAANCLVKVVNFKSLEVAT